MSFEGDGVLLLEQDPEVLIGTCNLEESTNFNAAYFNVLFYQSGGNSFTYEVITGENGTLSLVITNTEGDKVYYGDALLSTGQYEKENVVIYPNPIIKEIMIAGNGYTALNNIKIYTLNGVLVSDTAYVSGQVSVNVEGLHAGVYLLELIDDQGNRTARKFVKQ